MVYGLRSTVYGLVTIAYMTALTLVSIQPVLKGHGSDVTRQLFNNILHIPAYGLLTFLLIKSLSKLRYVYVLSFLFAVAFGIFNEYLQSFVPGRCVSGFDVVLNAIGSLVVVIAMKSKLTAVIARSPEGATKQSQHTTHNSRMKR